MVAARLLAPQVIVAPSFTLSQSDDGTQTSVFVIAAAIFSLETAGFYLDLPASYLFKETLAHLRPSLHPVSFFIELQASSFLPLPLASSTFI